MERFEQVKLDKTKIIEKEGMEISAYIAGVNSGVYGFPFVISVKTWTRKWFWRKFFYQEMTLNNNELIKLRDEFNKVIEWNNQKIKL